MITEGEGIVKTEHEMIKVIRAGDHFNGYGDQETFRKWLFTGIEELYQLADAQDSCGTRVSKLKQIVPEYTPGDTECVL